MEIQQGSDEWRQMRLGYVTGSKLGLFAVKSKEGELTKGQQTYLRQKIAEVMTGLEKKTKSTPSMDEGVSNEELARYEYERSRKVEVHRPVFVYSEEIPYFGVSPDGRVGTEGGIEVKCPDSDNFIGYTLFNDKIPKSWEAQIHGNIWVCNASWWDLVLYDPRILDPEERMRVIRFERDEQYIEMLRGRIKTFMEIYLDILKKNNIVIPDTYNSDTGA